MRLRNISDVPDSKLMEIIEFVDPGLAKDVKVVCRRSYGPAHGFSEVVRKEVTCYLPVEGRMKYPHYVNSDIRVKYVPSYYEKWDEEKDIWRTWKRWMKIQVKGKRKSGYMSGLYLSRDEYIVHLIAHELRHQWQRRRPPKSEWAWGCQGKRTKFAIERDADAYQTRKVREWRRIHNTVQAFPDDSFIRK
jgi:hypothetical protein